MSKVTALVTLFSLLGMLVVFHVLILIQVIPFDQVWGGRLSSVEEMQTFEIFSIAINSLMLVVLAVKYKQLKQGKSSKLINILIGLFAVFFGLNTVGNLFAENMWELVLGSTFSVLAAVLCIKILKKDKPKLRQ